MKKARKKLAMVIPKEKAGKMRREVVVFILGHRRIQRAQPEITAREPRDLINRTTVISTKKSQIFSTYRDNKPSVNSQVLKGERSMPKNNHLLSEFELREIYPAPRGQPQIRVTLGIVSNGIL